MKIERATLLLDSSHDSFRREQGEESIRISGMIANGESLDVVSVTISQAARSSLEREISARREELATSNAAAVENAGEIVDNDPMLALVKAMVELLTGRPVKTFSASELKTSSGPATSTATLQPTRAVVFRKQLREEYEMTRFVARGLVRTSDGRDLKFELQMEMERHFRAEATTETRSGPPRKDPLVLNFAGTPAALLDTRFSFDLDDDGNPDALPMLARGSGFLVFDGNGNGLADTGLELFGPRTDDGFGELEQLDQDRNGWIDESDPAFAQLGIWLPTTAGSRHVIPLSDVDIGALSLARVSTPFSLRGSSNAELGEVRETGIALGENGRAYGVQEIVLARER